MLPFARASVIKLFQVDAVVPALFRLTLETLLIDGAFVIPVKPAIVLSPNAAIDSSYCSMPNRAASALRCSRGRPAIAAARMSWTVYW